MWLLSCINTICGGRLQLNLPTTAGRQREIDNICLEEMLLLLLRLDMNINDWWVLFWRGDPDERGPRPPPPPPKASSSPAQWQTRVADAAISLLFTRISALSANSATAIIRCVLCKDKGHYFCAGAAGSLMCENRPYSRSVYLITFQVTRHDLCLAPVQDKQTAAFKMQI